MAYTDPEKARANRRKRYAETRDAALAYKNAWLAEHPVTKVQKFGYTANVNAKRYGNTEQMDWRNLPVVGPCVYCGLDDDTVRWDHVIPLSRGGRNHSSNIVRCCLPCNFAKNKRTPEEHFNPARPENTLNNRRASTRRNYAAHHDERLEYNRIYRATHREARAEYKREYERANREKVTTAHREYMRARKLKKAAHGV